MNIIKDIQELVKAEIISPETANKIQEYYRKKEGQSQNRLFIVFGVLGAILMGLGIILILAHNWDNLPRTIKTFFALFPLFIGQILCGFVLLRKRESIAWRESSSAFLFFAVGASLSLVSQIYNIDGELSSLVLTWMLLVLPLIYVMRSSIVSLLYIVGISYYAIEVGYWSYSDSESYTYWLLILSVLPHYYLLYKKNTQNNFMSFHNWFIPLSIIIVLGTVTKNIEELMYVAYFSLFAVFYLFGKFSYFKKQKPINNGFKILASLGTIILLLILSFNWFWEDLAETNFIFDEIISSPELYTASILTLTAGGLLFKQWSLNSKIEINLFEIFFIIFIIIFIIGLFTSLAAVFINIIVFVIGVMTIRNGAKQDHLGILNFGLLIITALVTCRFFDTDLSFVFRGLLFISVGVGFFVTNYRMLKKRKTNE